ncbi:hypothetical protein C8F01DRAFT_1262493 [Mycena amicta]|nr:hypothetical protein C8F01DRAFT_1262493 [Mycena amicta]
MLAQILVSVAASVAAYFILHALRILYRNLSSPLRSILPGPKIPNFLTGNLAEMTYEPKLASAWRTEFGPNFIFHTLFSVSVLHTSDFLGQAPQPIGRRPAIILIINGKTFRPLA